MNPHFHPYSELSSPHPPSPDNNNYHNHSGPPSHTNLSHPSGLNQGPGPNGLPPPHQMTNGHNHLSIGSTQLQQQNHDHHNHHGHHNHPPFGHGHGGMPPSHLGNIGGIGMHNNNNNNSSSNNNNSSNSGSIRHCAGCGGKIVERYLLHALDRYWHNSCLKCSCCGAMLAEIGQTCYTRGGMILCKTDYTRIFGAGACTACGELIHANEFVHRTGPASGGGAVGGGTGPPQHHVFHVNCFKCSKCTVKLQPGDRYYMPSGSLVCEQDWHKLLKSSTTATGTTTVRKGKVGRPRRSRD